jgi:hypothetical protein
MDRRWFLALAALLVSAAWYDGASTVFFLSQNRYMAEQNPLFGKHPSPERIFAEGGAIVACELAFAWWTIGRGRRRAWVWDSRFFP